MKAFICRHDVLPRHRRQGAAGHLVPRDGEGRRLDGLAGRIGGPARHPGSASGHWGYGNSGEETYDNALYVWTLQAAAQTADAENQPALAAQYQSDAAKTTAAINANLWDATAGAYVVDPGDGAHPQDGNVMAVLAGVATGQRETDVLNFLKGQWTKYGADTIDKPGNVVAHYVSPFISYYELLAYADEDTAEGTPDAMTLLKRTWPAMLSGDTTGTFWENVSLAGAPQLGAYTSLSHGWSAGVVPYLSNVLLGVTPTSGGSARSRCYRIRRGASPGPRARCPPRTAT